MIETQQEFSPQPFKWLSLAGLTGLVVLYGGEDIVDAFVRSREKESIGRVLTTFAHFLLALPIFVLAPFQFSRRFRARRPVVHQWCGRVFLSFSLVASLGALYLGVTYQGIGSRVPLAIFAIVWFGFSVAAWICAVRRAFAAHERFAVRAYAIALAFVFVRIIGEHQDFLFPFMADRALRGATGEWLSFVVPLIAIEAWYTWWPSIPRRRVPV